MVEKAAFMKKLIAPTDMTLINPFSYGTFSSWLSSTGVAKYPDFAGVMSLRSCPPKFASWIVFIDGAALAPLRAPWSPNPIAKEDKRKKTVDNSKIGTFTWDSIWYVSVRFTFRNSRYKIKMLTAA